MKKESERYINVMSGVASSKEDLKAFARRILLENGIDIDLVNIKDDGISIVSFTKLVKALYDAGYQEGFNHKQILNGERMKLEWEGAIMTRFQRKAKHIMKQNLINNPHAHK